VEDALMRALSLAVTLLCAVPLLAQDSRVRERDATWVAPPEDAAKPNPLRGRPDAAAGGRKLFQQRCATCHGDDGRGSAKAPDLLQPDVQSQTDGALFWKLSSGNTYAGMPAFSYLPAPQRWQLVLHLRRLTAAVGPGGR
jgi:mono/diheme cytochrome c family protein